MPTAVRRAAWAEWAGWICKERRRSLLPDVQRLAREDRKPPAGNCRGFFCFQDCAVNQANALTGAGRRYFSWLSPNCESLQRAIHARPRQDRDRAKVDNRTRERRTHGTRSSYTPGTPIPLALSVHHRNRCTFVQAQTPDCLERDRIRNRPLSISGQCRGIHWNSRRHASPR